MRGGILSPDCELAIQIISYLKLSRKSTLNTGNIILIPYLKYFLSILSECKTSWYQYEFKMRKRKFYMTVLFQFQKITKKMMRHMKDRLDLLAEFKGHRLDKRLIAHLIKHHCTSYTKCNEEN